MGYNILRRFLNKKTPKEDSVREEHEALRGKEDPLASVTLSILEEGQIDVSLKYNDDGLLSQMSIAELLLMIDETKFGETIIETLLKDGNTQGESILLLNVYRLYTEFRNKGPAVSPRDVFKT